jgi:hypothetical protein
VGRRVQGHFGPHLQSHPSSAWWSACIVGVDLRVLRCGATRSLNAPGVVPGRTLFIAYNQLTTIAGTTWPAELT